MSNPRYVPSIFLLAPGPWGSEQQLRELMPTGVPVGEFGDERLGEGDARIMLIRNPDGYGDLFQWSRSGAADAELVAAAATCPSAALVEFGAPLHTAGEPLARIVGALRQAGAVGVRVEASGAAMTWASWDDAMADPTALVGHATLVFNTEGTVFTTGMHAFERPDIQVEADDPHLVQVLANYQVVDDPVFATGHTFSIGPDAPRWALERWPDHRHSINDGRYNTYGVWRLVHPENALAAFETVPTIIPSLVAVLTSLEVKNERPLTEAQVRKVVEDAPSIAVEVSAAIAMERARGYVDIEPRLAWEQWQIVRDHYR